MNWTFQIIRQTTVFIFCGLLCLPIFAQQRVEENIENVITIFSKAKSTFSSSYQIKVTSSDIFPNYGLSQSREAFYICTPKDGKGFVIVSGDERMPTVLGYSDKNDFDTENIPPNVRYWLSNYVDTYKSIEANIEESSASSLSQIKEEGVEPLLGEIQWGQGDPYNRLCPIYQKERCVTGCVATAMAQVMKYYSYPEKGKGIKSYWTDSHQIHVSKDFSEVEFSWDSMLNKYDEEYTNEEANAVATLMYCCGVSVEMDYSPNGSGAYQHSLLEGYINNFSYDSDAAILFRNYCNSNDWHSTLIKELNEGRPVNYGGSSMADGGHSFVLDGYQISSDNVYPDYHVNWGWNGRCDGYYQITSLHPSEEGIPYTHTGFNEGQQMTIGIQPENHQQEDRNYLCTSNLKLSNSKVRPGEKIKVYTSEVYNMSYKDFTGHIAIALYSIDDNSLINLSSKSVNQLSFMDGIENFSLDIIIPEDINDGTYSVRLLSKRFDSETWFDVYSSSYASLTVSDNGSDNPENTEAAILGCSDVEFIMTEDKTDIYVKLYEVISLKEKAFVGDVFMMMTDKYGNPLATISNIVHPEELGYLEILKAPLELHGKIEEKWPDGEYKLYFCSQHIEEDVPSYIMYYDWTVMGKAPSELYYDLRISNGQVIINGHIYLCEPTSVSSSCSFSRTERHVWYTLTGRKMDCPTEGLNIVKLPNESFKKVVKRR